MLYILIKSEVEGNYNYFIRFEIITFLLYFYLGQFSTKKINKILN